MLERNQSLSESVAIQDPDYLQTFGSGLAQRLRLKASAASRPRSSERVAQTLATGAWCFVSVTACGLGFPRPHWRRWLW
jgi:hypothetical protein